MKNIIFLILFFSSSTLLWAQEGGWFSLGARSTFSAFEGDGLGIGTGGQFRLQVSDRINTDWYADYISITQNSKVRSLYAHIGWSVLFYPLKEKKTVQPYILAGHCFDYNKMTEINNQNNSKDRYGSAAQAGLGTHFHLTNRMDISLTCQYMIHLTKDLHAEFENDEVIINKSGASALQGHFLTTISLNFKIIKLWKKNI